MVRGVCNLRAASSRCDRSRRPSDRRCSRRVSECAIPARRRTGFAAPRRAACSDPASPSRSASARGHQSPSRPIAIIQSMRFASI